MSTRAECAVTRGGRACRNTFSRSTRARPRPEPSCSISRSHRWRARNRSCARFIRRPGWSSTILKKYGRRPWRPCARRWGAPARRPRTSRRWGSPTSARPRSSGTAQRAARSTMPSCGRIGARRTVARRCGSDGHEADDRGAHRPAARSLFFRHQDRVAARPRRGRARGGGRGSACVRDGRQLPAVAAYRRQGARNRCDQRVADAAAGHPPWQLGRRALPLFDVPEALLPEVRDCAGDFGTTDHFGGPIRILGIAGDQQAAMVGQGCFAPGMVKSTYGTGCFALINTGRSAGGVEKPSSHHHRLPARRSAAPTRSKGRSSSPARRCNGCAMRSR